MQFCQLAEDVDVVDFSCSRLVPPRNVGNMDQPDVLDIVIQSLDQVPLRYLRMVYVEEKSHIGMVYLADNLESFCRRWQIVLRVLLQVNILEHDRNVILRGNISQSFQ